MKIFTISYVVTLNLENFKLIEFPVSLNSSSGFVCRNQMIVKRFPILGNDALFKTSIVS